MLQYNNEEMKNFDKEIKEIKVSKKEENKQSKRKQSKSKEKESKHKHKKHGFKPFGHKHKRGFKPLGPDFQQYDDIKQKLIEFRKKLASDAAVNGGEVEL